jgi:hypothetical protein
MAEADGEIDQRSAASFPASPMIPRRSAAGHSRLTSPTGSAAATSSSRCVSSGSDRTLREGLLDAPGQRTRVEKPEPAREFGRRPHTRQLQQRQRVAARLGDDPGRPRARPAVPACPTPATSVRRRRRADGSRRWARGRRTRWRSAPPAGAATNASVCAEARSSHWTSSTRHTSGSTSAAPASRLRIARATMKRSGATPSCIPSVTRSAPCCGLGNASSPSSVGAHT